VKMQQFLAASGIQAVSDNTEDVVIRELPLLKRGKAVEDHSVLSPPIPAQDNMIMQPCRNG